VHYGHRHSYDIDLFLSGSDAVHDLAPNRNPATRALLDGRAYEYPGNYLKLTLDEGEIDFIVASARTRDPTQDWTFEGRALRIDTPWETAVKKMFHRPSQFKVRDVFDLAAVIERHPAELAASLDEVADRMPRLLDRIDRLRPAYERLAEQDVYPTEDGRRYMAASAIEGVYAFLTAQSV